jgi:glutamyl-Q tRNA(Asp) synthetase
MSPYRGRFAPSPTGPLHAGSLVAALASWLDARAHEGRWLVRIEDVDQPRCVAGAEHEILRQLQSLGLVSDEAVVRQSQRGALYQAALDRLVDTGLAYPCGCTRRDVELALSAQGHVHARHDERVYPGTCRNGLNGKPARSWRLKVGEPQQPVLIDWHDRRLGAMRQDVSHEVGDFVLKRADGLWAYQVAVVVDDAAQGITDVVRGEDLADNTARQLHLQLVLGLPALRYLHTPLVLDASGEKLSKTSAAPPLDVSQPLPTLRDAASRLSLAPIDASDVPHWLAQAVQAWRSRWVA